MAHTVYHELANHLDRLPGGFPATPDGVELRILKRLFTESEARLACRLTLIPEAAHVVAYRCGLERDTAAAMLESMWRKGLILKDSHQAKPDRYMASQFVVGGLGISGQSTVSGTRGRYGGLYPDPLQCESVAAGAADAHHPGESQHRPAIADFAP